MSSSRECPSLGIPLPPSTTLDHIQTCANRVLSLIEVHNQPREHSGSVHLPGEISLPILMYIQSGQIGELSDTWHLANMEAGYDLRARVRKLNRSYALDLHKWIGKDTVQSEEFETIQAEDESLWCPAGTWYYDEKMCINKATVKCVTLHLPEWVDPWIACFGIENFQGTECHHRRTVNLAFNGIKQCEEHMTSVSVLLQGSSTFAEAEVEINCKVSACADTEDPCNNDTAYCVNEITHSLYDPVKDRHTHVTYYVHSGNDYVEMVEQKDVLFEGSSLSWFLHPSGAYDRIVGHVVDWRLSRGGVPVIAWVCRKFAQDDQRCIMEQVQDPVVFDASGELVSAATNNHIAVEYIRFKFTRVFQGEASEEVLIKCNFHDTTIPKAIYFEGPQHHEYRISVDCGHLYILDPERGVPVMIEMMYDTEMTQSADEQFLPLYDSKMRMVFHARAHTEDSYTVKGVTFTMYSGGQASLGRKVKHWVMRGVIMFKGKQERITETICYIEPYDAQEFEEKRFKTDKREDLGSGPLGTNIVQWWIGLQGQEKLDSALLCERYEFSGNRSSEKMTKKTTLTDSTKAPIKLKAKDIDIVHRVSDFMHANVQRLAKEIDVKDAFKELPRTPQSERKYQEHQEHQEQQNSVDVLADQDTSNNHGTMSLKDAQDIATRVHCVTRDWVELCKSAGDTEKIMGIDMLCRDNVKVTDTPLMVYPGTNLADEACGTWKIAYAKEFVVRGMRFKYTTESEDDAYAISMCKWDGDIDEEATILALLQDESDRRWLNIGTWYFSPVSQEESNGVSVLRFDTKLKKYVTPWYRAFVPNESFHEDVCVELYMDGGHKTEVLQKVKVVCKTEVDDVWCSYTCSFNPHENAINKWSVGNVDTVQKHLYMFDHIGDVYHFDSKGVIRVVESTGERFYRKSLFSPSGTLIQSTGFTEDTRLNRLLCKHRLEEEHGCDGVAFKTTLKYEGPAGHEKVVEQTIDPTCIKLLHTDCMSNLESAEEEKNPQITDMLPHEYRRQFMRNYTGERNEESMLCCTVEPGYSSYFGKSAHLYFCGAQFEEMRTSFKYGCMRAPTGATSYHMNYHSNGEPAVVKKEFAIKQIGGGTRTDTTAGSHWNGGRLVLLYHIEKSQLVDENDQNGDVWFGCTGVSYTMYPKADSAEWSTYGILRGAVVLEGLVTEKRITKSMFYVDCTDEETTSALPDTQDIAMGLFSTLSFEEAWRASHKTYLQRSQTHFEFSYAGRRGQERKVGDEKKRRVPKHLRDVDNYIWDMLKKDGGDNGGISKPLRWNKSTPVFEYEEGFAKQSFVVSHGDLMTTPTAMSSKDLVESVAEAVAHTENDSEIDTCECSEGSDTSGYQEAEWFQTTGENEIVCCCCCWPEAPYVAYLIHNADAQKNMRLEMEATLKEAQATVLQMSQALAEAKEASVQSIQTIEKHLETTQVSLETKEQALKVTQEMLNLTKEKLQLNTSALEMSQNTVREVEKESSDLRSQLARQVKLTEDTKCALRGSEQSYIEMRTRVESFISQAHGLEKELEEVKAWAASNESTFTARLQNVNEMHAARTDELLRDAQHREGEIERLNILVQQHCGEGIEHCDDTRLAELLDNARNTMTRIQTETQHRNDQRIAKLQEAHERELAMALAKAEERHMASLSPPASPSKGSECVVCMDNPVEMMIMPCRHVCICQNCAKTLEIPTIDADHHDGGATSDKKKKRGKKRGVRNPYSSFEEYDARPVPKCPVCSGEACGAQKVFIP